LDVSSEITGTCPHFPSRSLAGWYLKKTFKEKQIFCGVAMSLAGIASGFLLSPGVLAQPYLSCNNSRSHLASTRKRLQTKRHGS